MSKQEWWGVSEKLPMEETNDVYGYALRAENRRRARKQTGTTRKAIEQVRAVSFRFGMAWIAVENELGGGGTWASHAPHWMFIESEQLIDGLLRRRSAAPASPKALARSDQLLRTCLSLSKPTESVLERPVNRPRLHRFAGYAAQYGKQLERLKMRFPVSSTPLFDQFRISWITRYLSERGADKVLLP